MRRSSLSSVVPMSNTRVFMPEGNANDCTVRRGAHTITLMPAEVDKATKIIGIALGMETLDAVPSHITNTPFVIRFFNDDMLALERNDTKGSIPFKFSEGDELITTLQQAQAICVNDRTLAKRPGKR